jgi:hypothetical protein
MPCEKCISPTECDGVNCWDDVRPVSNQPLIYRLRKRAEIRRNSKDRLSVQENRTDRIADLLEEAANELEKIRSNLIYDK